MGAAELSTDDWGRITLPKETRDRFGERYRLVELQSSTKLLPIPDDPVASLRAATVDELKAASMEELRDAALEGGREQVGEHVRRRRLLARTPRRRRSARRSSRGAVRRVPRRPRVLARDVRRTVLVEERFAFDREQVTLSIVELAEADVDEDAVFRASEHIDGLNTSDSFHAALAGEAIRSGERAYDSIPIERIPLESK